MGPRDTPPPAVVEYAPADPNIVPAADAPLVDPDVSPDVFGITRQANDAEAAVEADVDASGGRKPWYKRPSVWWYVVFSCDVLYNILIWFVVWLSQAFTYHCRIGNVPSFYNCSSNRIVHQICLR